MKPINRCENPRIEIELRCYVAAPATRARSAVRTESIRLSGLSITWKSEPGAVPAPDLGPIVTVETEFPPHGASSPKCIHRQEDVTRIWKENPDATTAALHLNHMDFRPLQGPSFFSPAAPAASTA
jgi:hypothetical protein